MSNFSWKIQHTDLASRCMVVEYSKYGISIPLNIPMPEKTEEISTVIHKYAPLLQWEQATKPIASVQTGMTGTGYALPGTHPLDQLKAAAKGKINQYREMIIKSGVSFNGYQYNSDDQTVNRLSAVITSAQSGIPLSSNFAWRTATNEMIPMTLADLCALLKKMTELISVTYTTSWDKKAQIDNATTEEEINAVEWAALVLGVRA